MKKLSISIVLLTTILLVSCTSKETPRSEEQLLRIPYVSQNDNSNREYFVYLPKGYDENSDKEWPILMFLHGDGERGNGTTDLDFVKIHGPLYEAWVQKRDLPFIMIVPQLHMFGRDTLGIGYIDNRVKEWTPIRYKDSIPTRPTSEESKQLLTGKVAAESVPNSVGTNAGWDNLQEDLMGMLDKTLADYNTDKNRIYLSGLSYGGRGTWYTASKHTERFAAISPVVGWGHPDLMAPIAKAKLPIWEFTGGRDGGPEYYYVALNKLAELGHHNVRFTNHEDTGHVNTWRRVYEGQDIYDWFLSHSK